MEVSFELRVPPGYDKPVEYVRAKVDAHEVHRLATEFDRVAFRDAYKAFLATQTPGYVAPELGKQKSDVESSATPEPATPAPVPRPVPETNATLSPMGPMPTQEAPPPDLPPEPEDKGLFKRFPKKSEK